MLLRLPNILLPADLAEVRRNLESAPFIEGKASGKASLKNNLQSGQGNPGLEAATQRVMRALASRSEFQAFALPRQVTLIFNRYDQGMFYKTHMDAAVMGGMQRQPLRSDISFTVFLSEPGEYDGGELVMQTPLGELRVKEPAGSIVIYPSTMLHRVEAVTSGVRLAAVGWIQSMLRDAARREIVFELEQLRQEIARERSDSPWQERLDHIKENLMRMWVEV